MAEPELESASLRQPLEQVSEDSNVKAKMPPSQKPPEPGDYDCIWCDTVFAFEPERNSLECPSCGNKDRKDLVPVYITNLAEDDSMYTSSEFPGG